MKFNKILLIILLLHIYNINAEISIEITQGVDSNHTISIVPFQYCKYDDTSELYNPNDIITNDLKNSGKFSILNTSLLPQKPNSIAEVIPLVWNVININSIVIGKLEQINKNNYIISYQLIDTSGKYSILLSKNKFHIEKKWLRYAIHMISNEIFEKITGIKGAFCTKIAYILYNHTKKYAYELWISDYDGYNSIPIYNSVEPLMSPAWSPDGKQLMYVVFFKGHSMLVLHTLSNGTIRKIINFPQHNGAPAFSPDGKKIAFALSKTGSLNLYVMDLNSNKIIQITNNRNNNTEPSWFPDNQHLSYTSDQGGTPQIYKINISNGISERLSWLGDSNQNSNVSKDGEFVLLVNRSNHMQNIAKLNLSNYSMQILTNTLLDETPSISPNNIMMVYSTMQDTNSVLKLISINGKHTIQLPIINGQIRFPAWSPYI